jgi:hypothetical protein
MRRSQRWDESSPWTKVLVMMLTAVQVSLAVSAWADLAERPAEQVNGPSVGGRRSSPSTSSARSSTSPAVAAQRPHDRPARQGDGFVGAEIPYAGDDYSMLVLVPDEGRFEDVRRTSRPGSPRRDRRHVHHRAVRTPAAEVGRQLRIDLLDWLSELGAAPGSYPGISPDAFLDAAVHAADITVDEQGTVAAAATALGFNESGPPEPELTVAANRPFVYLIRHRPTGLVLFTGHVTNPT